MLCLFTYQNTDWNECFYDLKRIELPTIHLECQTFTAQRQTMRCTYKMQHRGFSYIFEWFWKIAEDISIEMTISHAHVFCGWLQRISGHPSWILQRGEEKLGAVLLHCIPLCIVCHLHWRPFWKDPSPSMRLSLSILPHADSWGLNWERNRKPVHLASYSLRWRASQELSVQSGRRRAMGIKVQSVIVKKKWCGEC